MDFMEMAEAIAFALNVDCWKAVADCGEINFTNEDGEQFIISVEKVGE